MMLAKTTLDPVQVRLVKGEIQWKHRREWRSKRLDAYFASMLAPYGAEPTIIVPEKFTGYWFVVQVQPSQERVSAGALIGRRFTCYLPMRMRKIKGRHAHHHVKVERPMLPGYVLVSFDPFSDDVGQICGAPGVLGVLGYDTEWAGVIVHRPVPVPIPVLYRIRDKEAELVSGARVLRIDDQPVEVGDTVQVIDGPFASFLGIVVELLFERERVKVEVDIFGRKTPVELGVDQLVVI